MTDITPSPIASPSPAPAEAPSEPRSHATFDVLPLSRELRETLAEIGYVNPTPVQLAVWEPATRGRDSVVQARTGTGKTAAFGLPIVDHIVRRSLAEVQVLALCPTRELALQVTNEIERLGKRKNVKVAAIYGGAPMQRQIDQIADGAQVVVGTPGRVLDHLRRGTLDPKRIKLLVLDEADEMLSMGFEREVTAILDSLPKERQTLLFSATLPPDIERMAKKLNAPEYLTLSGDHVGALEIDHYVYFVASDKIGSMLRVIEVENPESAIVFCNTRDETERLAQALTRNGYDADWLNGDLPQSDRERVMAKTREGRLRFLVCTDVAARGIDISHLTHVINYDFPQDAESYVHRTGRTGRAGRTGTAISLITPQDVGGLYLVRLTYKIRPVERQIPSEGELKTRAEADLVAMLGEAFSSVHADDLALARRLLTHELCETIVAGLLREHLGARPDAQRTATTSRKATRPPRVERVERAEPAAPKAEPVAAKAEPVAPRVEPVAPKVEPKVEAVAAPAEAPTPAPAEAPREAREQAPREERRERGDRRPREGGFRENDRGPRGEGGFRENDRGPRPEGGFRENDRGPRPEGGFRENDRGPRPEGGFRENDRGPRPEGGFRENDRGPRPEGDRGPRPEGDRGPRGEGERGPRGRGRDRGPEGRRPRGEGRPRDPSHIPVSAAEGRHEGDPNVVPTRHADFISWQPPAEEGDDEPILGSGGRVEGRRPRGEERQAPFAAPAEQLPEASFATGPQAASAGALRAPAVAAPPAGEAAAGDFAEIYVNVGRREGARAADFQRLLTERGIDKENVRRIRVRERNAFVSVRREDLEKAIEALTGANVAGKTTAAEIARERGEADAPEAAPAAVAGEAAPTAETAERAPAGAEAAPNAEAAAESDAAPTDRRSAG